MKLLAWSFFFMIISTSCRKYLEISPNNKLAVPSTLKDLQALLDAYNQINFVDLGIGDVCSDDNIVHNDIFDGFDEYNRALYTWDPGTVIPNYSVYSGNVWSTSFNIIYRANTVLYYVDRIERTSKNSDEYDNVKGQALFLRAKSFLQLAWIFSLPYDSITSDNDLGIPLRIDPDFNLSSIRGTVRQTYNQVISDFKNANSLLPVRSIHPIRPGKAASYGYLSRCYLSMRNYELAALYADSVLELENNLMDFNNAIPDTNSLYPIPQLNNEVIYYSTMAMPTPLYYGNVEPSLYEMYENNDWRKKLFFQITEDSLIKFAGSYDGSFLPFTGIATDEIYLTLSECEVRLGNIERGVSILNQLLSKRIRHPYNSLNATNKDEILKIVMAERRKELVFRDLRWSDIRRLNKEGYNITLSRDISGVVYSLPPNDLRYAICIPEDIIERSGMLQNPR